MEAGCAADTEGELDPLGPRDFLRGLLLFTARGRGRLDAASIATGIRERLARTIAAVEGVAAAAAATREAAGVCLAAAVAEGAAADAAQHAFELLSADIDRAESQMTAAHEAEAVALEAALERAPDIVAAAYAAEAGAALGPSGVAKALAELTAMLPALLSPSPLELGTFGISEASVPPLNCRLIAPRPLVAADVELRALGSHVGTSPPFRVRFGSKWQLLLTVTSSDTAGWGDEEWDSALTHLARCVSAAALYREAGTASTTTLDVDVQANMSSRSVAIVVDLPKLRRPERALHLSLSGTADVSLLIVVGGVRPPGSDAFVEVPLFSGGMQAPLNLPIPRAIMYPTPAISRDGRLFVPDADAVHVWGPTGAKLPVIDNHGIVGLHFVAIDDDSDSLFLGGGRVVALRLSDPAAPPRWTVDFGTSDEFGGLAVFSRYGIVVVASYRSRTAVAFRIADGVRVSELRGLETPIHICTDPDAATVFMSQNHTALREFCWRPASGDLGRTGVETVVRFSTENFHPMAYMPPTATLPACIVVGTWGAPELIILSLPGRELLHRHKLASSARAVRGLAGDPSGSSLAVCHASGCVVLPWPLPGCAGTS